MYMNYYRQMNNNYIIIEHAVFIEFKDKPEDEDAPEELKFE